jgi:hypothetical protein
MLPELFPFSIFFHYCILIIIQNYHCLLNLLMQHYKFFLSITQILIDLVPSNQIDGAVVVLIKCLSDLLQVCGFLQVHQIPHIKLNPTI